MKKNNKTGRGNTHCPNCNTVIPVKISKCFRCNHVFYKITPHAAQYGKYGKYTNIMTPREQLTQTLNKYGYSFDKETEKRFVKNIKNGNIEVKGRKFLISLDALVNIMAD